MDFILPSSRKNVPAMDDLVQACCLSFGGGMTSVFGEALDMYLVRAW